VVKGLLLAPKRLRAQSNRSGKINLKKPGLLKGINENQKNPAKKKISYKGMSNWNSGRERAAGVCKAS